MAGRRLVRSGLLAAAWIGSLLTYFYGLFVPHMTPAVNPIGAVDLTGYFFPRFRMVGEAARGLRLAFWDATEFAGVPILAMAQPAALYPPHWAIFSAIDSPAGIQLTVLLHLGLLGFGTFALARELGASELAAGLAAVSVGFSSFVGDSLYHPTRIACLAWAPLVLLSLSRVVDRSATDSPTRLATASLTAAFTLQLLAGYPEFALDTALVCALMLPGLVGAVGFGRLRGARLPGALAVAALVVALLTAPQTLPLAAALGSSARASSAELVPVFKAVTERYGGIAPGIGLALHLSPAVLLLGLTGALSFGRTAVPLLVAALSTAALATVLSEPMHRLPLFSLFRSPVCWMGLFQIPAAGLAALGFDRWLGESATERRRRGLMPEVGALALTALSLPFMSPRGRIVAGLTVVALALGRLGPRSGRLMRMALVALTGLSLWTWVPPALDQSLVHRFAAGTPPYPPPDRELESDATALARVCGDDGDGRWLGRLIDYRGIAGRGFLASASGFPEPLLAATSRRVLADLGVPVDLLTVDDAALGRSTALLDALDVGCLLDVAGRDATLATAGFLAAGSWSGLSVYRRSHPGRARLVFAGDADVGSRQASIRVDRPADERISIEVIAPEPASLVVSEAFDPGWQAALDGTPSAVHPAADFGMTVEVPSGRHQLALRYRPQHFTVALVACGLGFVGLVALVVPVTRRPARNAAA
jgi:hypothetical protein